MSHGQGIHLESDLQALPKDRPVVLLIRHSDRFPLPKNEVGNHISLTPVGRKRASQLGRQLKGRIVAARSSSVPRCIETTQLILDECGVGLSIQEEPLLGAPGCFIQNPELAWQSFLDLDIQGVVQHQLSNTKALPGFYATPQGASALVGALPKSGG